MSQTKIINKGFKGEVAIDYSSDPVVNVMVENAPGAVVLTGGPDASVANFSNASEKAALKAIYAGDSLDDSKGVYEANNIVLTNVSVANVMGGAVALNANGKVAKSISEGAVASVGEVNITTVSGSFKRIYGGGEGYGSTVDSVNINYNGGKVHTIYGGGVNGGAVNGNVNINIAGGTIYSLDSDTISSIYAGGNNGVVNGDATVTFSSGASKVKFNGTVSGGGSGRNGIVIGTSTLIFDDYAGKFNATIKSFDVVKIQGGSSVTLSKSQSKTMKSATYEFVVNDDSFGVTDAMLTWNKSFDTGKFVVTIDSAAEEVLRSGIEITLVASSSFKKATSFDASNILVQDSFGNKIADYSYEIEYIYDKKGGSVVLKYTGEDMKLTGVVEGVRLNDANDTISALAGSEVRGRVNLGGGINKFDVEGGAYVSGTIVADADSTNTINVSGTISGNFDTAAGSSTDVILNSGRVGKFESNGATVVNGQLGNRETTAYQFVASALVFGAGNETVYLNGNSVLTGISFGKGNDALVINAVTDIAGNSNFRVSSLDGNDAIVVNVSMTLDANFLALASTNNSLVIGKGAVVDIANGNGLYAFDGTGTMFSGIYLNDNAMLTMGQNLFVRNYQGDIVLGGTAAAGIVNANILGTSDAANAAVAKFFDGSNLSGFNGRIVGTAGAVNAVNVAGKADGYINLGGTFGDSVNFFWGGKDVAVGGALRIEGAPVFNVDDNVVGVIASSDNFNIMTDVIANLQQDGQLVITGLDSNATLADDSNVRKYAGWQGVVAAGNISVDTDFSVAKYQGVGNIYFLAGSRIINGADITVGDKQILWLNGATYNPLETTIFFNGADSAMGFLADSVIDWQSLNIAEGANFGFVVDNAATLRVDGFVSFEDAVTIVANTLLLNDAKLGLRDTVYIQDRTNGYTDTDWIATAAGTEPFSKLQVLDKARFFGDLNFGASTNRLYVGDGVVFRGLQGVGAYDFANINYTNAAQGALMYVGASTIYGAINLNAANDVLFLNDTKLTGTVNMAAADLGYAKLPVLVNLGGGADTLTMDGAIVEGVIDTADGDDQINVIGSYNAEDKSFEATTTQVGAILASGGVLSVNVFANATLTGANGNALLINAINDTASINVVTVGRGTLVFDDMIESNLVSPGATDIPSNGTLTGSTIISGVTNVLNAGVAEIIDYTGAVPEIEATIHTVTIPEDFVATVNADVVLREGTQDAAVAAGVNAFNFGVGVAANGLYTNATADRSKRAQVDMGNVTVTAAKEGGYGSVTMGNFITYHDMLIPSVRAAWLYSTGLLIDNNVQDLEYRSYAITNNADVSYRLNADEEGLINVNGNAVIDAGVISMVGANNIFRSNIDLFSGEQAVINMNDNSVTITTNGDVTMYAVSDAVTPTGGRGSVPENTFANVADIGITGINKVTVAGVESKSGVINGLDKSKLTATVNGDLSLLGVGNSNLVATDVDVRNLVRLRENGTVTGNIVIGEYYRDSTAFENWLVYEKAGKLNSESVTMLGQFNRIDAFGTTDTAAGQTVSMYGQVNTIRVGGAAQADQYIGGAFNAASIGNVVGDNVYDIDGFAAENYMPFGYATNDLWAYGSDVLGDVTFVGSKSPNKVVGSNTVLVQSSPAAAPSLRAATITGNVTGRSNQFNNVMVSGLAGARASIGGAIDLTTTAIVGVGNNTLDVSRGTVGGSTTMTTSGVGYNEAFIGWDAVAAAWAGDARIGDLTMNAKGAVSTNSLSVNTIAPVAASLATDVLFSNTIGNVVMTSEANSITANNIVAFGNGIKYDSTATADAVLYTSTSIGNIDATVKGTAAGVGNSVVLASVKAGAINLSATVGGALGTNVLTVTGEAKSVWTAGAITGTTWAVGETGDVKLVGNDTVSITTAKVGAIDFGAGVDTLTVVGTASQVGTIGNSGLLTINSAIALNASSIRVSGVVMNGNALSVSGSLTAVSGATLNVGAAAVTGAAILDFAKDGVGIAAINGTMNGWDAVKAGGSMDIKLDSSDIAAGATATVLNLTGLTAGNEIALGSIDLSIYSAAGVALQDITLAWNATTNKYESSTAVDGKIWSATRTANTLTIGAVAAV